MKRLFVSLMVIGGSILFGMQAAESAPMGSGKVRPDKGLRRCDKIRNPERRAKCRAKVRARLGRERRGGGGRMKADRARKRCSNIKSLRARAACCAKIRPASRLSPKRKLCRPVSVRARVKARVRTRVKDRARTRAKGQRAGRPKAKLGCDRFTTERARKTCRGLPAARARAKAAGCSKIRDKDKKSICFRQAKMCGDLRDPKKIAKCRARVTPRHLGRKRCDRIKSLGARAACCAKIRPASRLSPKLCRPVSGPGSVKARARRPRGR